MSSETRCPAMIPRGALCGEDHPLRGVFKGIDSPSKLVFTWQWQREGGMEGMGEETIVTVLLKDMGGKTEMTLTHELPNKESRDNHEMGWVSSFVRLESVLR